MSQKRKRLVQGEQDERYNIEKNVTEITVDELKRLQNQENVPDDGKSKQQTLNFIKPKVSPMNAKRHQVKQCGKFKLHYKSHLNDPTLQPRRLEMGENIFEIIMPWLEDLQKETAEKNKELLSLGLIDKQEFNKRAGSSKKDKGRDTNKGP